MAKLDVSGIPQEFEMARRFEVQDASEADLRSMRQRLQEADIEADARAVLGRSIDTVAGLIFIRAVWARFGQFVQRVPPIIVARSSDDWQGAHSHGPAVGGAPVVKEEIVTRYQTAVRS